MKKKTGSGSALYIVVTVLLAVVFVFAAYQALRIYLPQRSDQKSFDELKDLIDDGKEEETESASPSDGSGSGSSGGGKKGSRYQSLYDMNNDFAGWITVEGTDIDYPVMKSGDDDPEYYLRRDFNRDYSISGCPFIGEGCDADSDSFIIYGHNMASGIMFGTLDRFADASFASAHRDFQFNTLTEDRVYRVFAAFRTKIDPDADFKYYDATGDLTREEYEDAVRAISSLSVIDLDGGPAYPAQILFLSTCSYHTDDGRFVVAAYRIR